MDDVVRLRGHHLETLHSCSRDNFKSYRAITTRDYTKKFSDISTDLYLKILHTPNLKIQVIVGLDDVCNLKCPIQDHFCRSLQKAHDRRILRRFGLDEDGVYSSGYLLGLKNK